MSEWTEQQADEAIAAVLKRTATDAEFRQLALSDPAAAVKAETGKDLPDGFIVKVVENVGASLTIVLPDFVGSGELSDAELEAVAGGKGKSPFDLYAEDKIQRAASGVDVVDPGKLL